MFSDSHMNQRERVTIHLFGRDRRRGVGLLSIDMHKCLVTGVIAASVTTFFFLRTFYTQQSTMIRQNQNAIIEKKCERKQRVNYETILFAQ